MLHYDLLFNSAKLNVVLQDYIMIYFLLVFNIILSFMPFMLVFIYYGPEGRPYSDQRVRPSVRLSVCTSSVRPSVRPSQIIFADG